MTHAVLSRMNTTIVVVMNFDKFKSEDATTNATFSSGTSSSWSDDFL